MNRKAKKRAATAGAILLSLGVLHLSTKDASGDTGQCEIGHANPPIVGPCQPGYVPPTTVLLPVIRPYCPPGVVAETCTPQSQALPPPVEGKPLGVPVVVLAPPPVVTPPTTVDPGNAETDPCGDFSTKDVCASFQAAHPPSTTYQAAPVAVDTPTPKPKLVLPTTE